MNSYLNNLKLSTLLDLLRYRALHQSNKLAFTFLEDGETETGWLTYQELDQKARAIAAVLQSLSLTGERALLLHPPGLEFITAFFGCLYAGVVAIPAYPPRSNSRSMERVQAIVEDSQAKALLTTDETLADLKRRFPDEIDWAGLHVLTNGNVATSVAQQWCQPIVTSKTLAYLQYTSGSTSKPKGAMITHGNAIENSEHIAVGWETSSESVLVSWLPHFHDFGLVYAIIQPVYQGFPCIFMAPTSFIQQPIRWLQAISRYRATHTGAPNFAYELCVNKITPQQRATLDLSSWRVAINGAEPIRPETLQNFAELFTECGFRWSTLRPAYGLAETTLMVSGKRKKEMPLFYTVKASALEEHQIVELSEQVLSGRKLVGCGSKVLDMKVVIVNPTSLRRCLPNQVGEIWVSSKSVAQGYWRRTEETEQTFHAYLKDTGEGPFLRTGDLGFLKDDQLFVTGRIKDLIIIRGHNHYPQDIELTAEQSHPALRPSCSAAFSVDVDGEERLAIAVEVERTYLRHLNVDEVTGAIRNAVSQEHEIQTYAILLLKTGSIPKTSSGKIQRSACRSGFLVGSLNVVGDWQESQQTQAKLKHLQAEVDTLEQQLQNSCKNSSFSQKNADAHPSKATKVSQSTQAIQTWLTTKIAEKIGVNTHEIDIHQPFASYNLDSMAVVSLTGELENWLSRRLPSTLAYDYPTIETLAKYVGDSSHTQASHLPKTNDQNVSSPLPTPSLQEPIAIVGLACRFPNAKDPEAFWQLLHNGIDAISEVPETRWDINAFYDSNPVTPGKMSTRWSGFLEDIDRFDPLFFGISPREAERMDPQQRLLLEVAWEALENAAIAPHQLSGSQTGVFIGISTNDYSRLQFKDYDRIDAYAGTSNAYSITANRLSYLLDLHGPSMAIDTACSSSLVAVHLACQSLRQSECDKALVGGVNLILSPELTITFSKAQMMAADGRCKTFDANADGYVRGEGCGMVVLKRLCDAQRDGDNILALIEGSAINQDGRSNGLTAPNGASQQAVIQQALKNAGVAPNQISYVETHGTGTPLGDPIEIESLKAVLMSDRSKDQPCVISSVKANIGHLEAAAGIASLIKVVLALQHEEIPPQIHFNQLNPYIQLENTSFFIPKGSHPWSSGSLGRFVGVSSFGFGGTNAHVVLAESPIPAKRDIQVERPLHILTLSAKSKNALEALAHRYQAFLESHRGVSLPDVCFSANAGRSHFAHRLAIVTNSKTYLQQKLAAFAGQQKPGLVKGEVHNRNRQKIAFLFTGQGSQYGNMGHQLYKTQPTFRQALLQCEELLRPYLEEPLLKVLYSSTQNNSRLHETAYTQPALFSLEYALAELWRSWGIVADAVIGHSLGEYVAATVAGVFSLEEALQLVIQRSRLVQSLPHNGEMAVVFACYEQVVNIVAQYKQHVSIAAVNGPENIVISGLRDKVQSVLEQFKSQGITVQPLNVSHAFHSPLIEPMLDQFESLATKTQFQTPRIDLVSNLTGQLFRPGEIPDANYWRRHARETVQFAPGINTLVQQGYEIFLEIGPSNTLVGMTNRCLPTGTGCLLSSLKQGQDDWQVLLNSLAVLETQGIDIDWAGFDQDYQRRRLPLPTYPFERKRYWIESEKQSDTKEPQTKKPNLKVDATVQITQQGTSLSQLRAMMAGVLQMHPDEVNIHTPFIEIGADSLVLVEAIHSIENTFGIKIAIRQFFEELTTIDALANYIDRHLSSDWKLKDSLQNVEVTASTPTQSSVLTTSLLATDDRQMPDVPQQQQKLSKSETVVERILSQQLQVMSQVMSKQLDILGNTGLSSEKSLTNGTTPSKSLNQTTPQANSSSNASPTHLNQNQANRQAIVPLGRKPESSRQSTPEQQQHLEELIANYTRRTQKSKQRKQAYHPILSDSRASAGFRPSIKEMLYPIVGQRSFGSRIWDIDGNEYIDITMGFGVLLFGHDAPFITEAIQERLQQGITFGPQSDLAGEVAELICQLTGVERVTFCSSGTEAVMTALRLARTATGRHKIVLFSGSYHGHFDGVLATAETIDGKLRSVPKSLGVTQNIIDDVLVLDYGSSESLEVIQAHAHELAAVLVEPVQSRRPDLQPREFLVKLRQLTQATGTALIFDEIITGFRIHPGGAQVWFGVEADLVTYGKIIGGGIPMGVVAGKASYMNGIDGGCWNYGDGSSPQADTTFFAGTFNKHPLAMVAARAVLQHLQQAGSSLQQELSDRTSRLAKTLNTHFEQENIPIRIVHFGSLFRFSFAGNMDLLFYHLIHKGVYVWEGRSCFLSTAHTDRDIAYIIQAVIDSVDEMGAAGFFPKRPPNLPNGDKPSQSSNDRKSSNLSNSQKSSQSSNGNGHKSSYLTSNTLVSYTSAEIETVPLTEAQKQLWVLTQVENEGVIAYNIPLTLELQGTFVLSAMQSAVERIVERHEALRTTISNQGDYQYISPSLTINVPLIDLSSLETTEQETVFQRWLTQESQTCFDLTQGPLLRIHVLKLEEQRHLLVLTVHHIIFDGWSMGVVLRELCAFYSAECQGNVWQPEAALQFQEYIQWQLQQSQTEQMAKHQAYWLKQFADSIPVLELPCDRTRPPIKTYTGARASIKLEASLYNQIKRLSRNSGCTLFMTLLASYMALLHRLTNQDDIVVGTPVLGRTLEGSKNLVGYCTHLLPIRSKSRSNLTFSEYLTLIRYVLLDAYANQDYTFAQLLNQLNLHRDLSSSPLVTATFNLDQPLTLPNMFGLTPQLVSPPVSYVQFDISLNAIESNGELLLEMDYNTDLFKQETVERMLWHFQTLLSGIVAAPQQRLSELPILTPTQYHQQLVEWNDTGRDYQQSECIHQLFAQIVEQTPNAVAVVDEGEALSYGELNKRANQLANYLQSLGVGADVLVGVCIERSIEMVVAWLAVLKAGGAYVPMDPAYPTERLSFMVEDAGVAVLLTQQHLLERLGEHQTQIVCVEREHQVIAQHSQKPPASSVTPENLAYVIYTSGSTGVPKGVAIEHRGLLNLVKWHQQEYSVAAPDRATQLAGVAFDASVWEVWPYLTIGASIYIPPEQLRLSTTKLLEWLAASAITICFLPTPLAEAIMQEAPPASRLALRCVLTGGDRLHNISDFKFSFELVNHYGPTENTVVTTSGRVPSGGCDDGLPPIGRPIANTQVYILDQQQQPVPVGVAGELYIGGASLARGYLNRPQLSAAKFLPNPFSQTPGSRLYRTGDLVRYLTDGNIEFLGRVDDQVKIRGFRIELGEIEAALGTHPAVQETVVMVQEDVPGNKRLVAYVVAKQQAGEQPPTPSSLRDFLAAKLPEYMVPSAIVLLDALPLTPNGKVDRRALPAPAPELAGELVLPRTPVEDLLVLMWSEVLGVQNVSIHDNFFTLGGHSLLATQLFSQLRETFSVDLPLRELFEFPTVAELGERIENARREDQGWQAPPLVPVAREERLPLSFAQARLWFLEQLKPGSLAYNVPGVVCLTGTLNIVALQESLNAIVQRHEVLRTTFTTVDGKPFGVVVNSINLVLPVVNLCGLPKPKQQLEVQRLATREAHTPFDLSCGPLLRATLLKLGDREHTLLLSMHHIVSDGWSVGVLLRELAALYNAFSQGQPSPLPELAIQYIDFTYWQRQWLTGEVLQVQLDYWQQKLANAPSLLELPTDRPRPPIQTFCGATQHLVLPKPLTEELKNLSQRRGVSLFMTLLAAFVTLLYRYTGESDICVGTPIANRNRRETEELIGFFVNTLVLRTDVSGASSFAELLHRVREVATEAYAHQDLPFEQLVEVLQPERSLSHQPLFQVMFALQNAPMPSVELSNLSLNLLDLGSATAKFDLTMSMEDIPQGLVASLEYNTDLFEAETIARMLENFQTLLAGIVAHPTQRIVELPLLTDAQQQQLLVEWNDTKVDRIHSDSWLLNSECFLVHQLFEATANRTPDAIALVYEDQQLTYRELNNWANSIAHHLRSQGVGPESIVGSCMERSIEMVVGLLAILKAGAAYVALDPTYPTERLHYMLSDSQVRVILTQNRWLNILPQQQAQIICLDRDWQNLSEQNLPNLQTHVTVENLAYVIYTSGSTGKPKGVLVRHQGLLNLIHWHQSTFEVTADDRATQLAGVAFDASVWELWPYLTIGASVNLVNSEIVASASDLQQWLVAHQITISFLPTPLAESLLNVEWSKNTALRILLTGGDKLHQYPSDSLPFVLVNNYGPTENTVVTTSGQIGGRGAGSSEQGRESSFSPSPSRVPPAECLPTIGRPISNTQVYILDPYLQPVPIGVKGELYIGVDNLARGYLNRPDLTAERFIPNPFSDRPGTRLYKTDDLVRYRANGNIEYLGRLGEQVKIRGFRIELGEIEVVLSQHPAVQETLVMLREDVPGNKRLVAYVVAQAGMNDSSPSPPLPLSPSSLKDFLKQKLPEYMVPSAIVLLETLPLTPNGKVDRRALPAPDEDREAGLVAACTPTEEILAHLWADVLKLEDVGIDENFFDLGGHSLLATQLVSRLRDTFGVDLPLRELFESPTVAELAARIENQYFYQPAPPIVPVERDLNLPLSFAQTRLWFLDHLEPESSAYNISGGMRLIGRLSYVALEDSFNEIIRRHEALRTSFVTVDGEPMQVIAKTCRLNLPLVDLQQLPPLEQQAEVERLGRQDANRPFNLSISPLLRATLLKLGDGEHVLLLSIHHIVSDGWSIGVFIHELRRLYDAYTQGQPSPLPELPIQYADFADWQRKWLTGEVLHRQLDYWQQQLANLPSLLELPTDRPRPPVQTFCGAIEPFAIPASLSQEVKNLSRRYGVTLFMTLLAAFQTLLYRYTATDDIFVGTPIANRNHSQTEALIGFFVNTLVLRTDLSDNPRFDELLHRVREVALGTYAHQDLPFEQLVEALQVERSLSHHPLFQVMFVLQNTPMPPMELAGVTLSLLEVTTVTAKFDLTLSMEDTDSGLMGVLEYNTDLFEQETIKRMLWHFQTLLCGIAADPQQRLSFLPILTPTQHHQQLVEWNDTDSVYPTEKCIHQLFEAQVQKTPDAVAVVFGEEQLTYQELNSRANQLAHHLQSLGVGPEALVGICVERSVEMVVGLLGILKAGGAYVPLDPTYPQQRLSYMLADSGVGVLLTHSELLSSLPSHTARVVWLDTDWGVIAQHEDENFDAGVGAKHLAYVIYTSGSTGVPKGVLVTHQGVNRLTINTNYINLQPKDVVAFASNFSFDAATFEVWGTLLHGAKLVEVSKDVVLSPKHFANFIQEQKISMLFLTTALFNQIANVAPSAFHSLQQLMFGGEAVDIRSVKEVLKNAPPQRLLHVYGPTESTTFTTWYLVQDIPEEATTIAIGRPISNTQIYILDSHLQPVPIGVAGELYIGGDGLARGYLNRPQLSAEKFLPNPFSQTPGSRLYRTGDLMRYLADGNIEFLGRVDDQVKIRGFRIELGEIEAALGTHPAVQETVVMVREDVPGNKRLVAYVVVKQQAKEHPAQSQGEQDSSPCTLPPTPSSLRDFLTSKLPEYMVPSAIAFLDALPLTPNGKVDRRALPVVDTREGEAYMAPRTVIEERLALIWATVLGLEQVGIHDNFFELGGDSILSIQIVAKANQAGLVITAKQLFEHQTIAQLATVVSTSGVSTIQQGLVTGEVLLTPIQQWFFQQQHPQPHHWNQSILLSVRQPLDQSLLAQLVQQLLLHHDALRLRFVQQDLRWQQMYDTTENAVVLTQADLAALSPSQQTIAIEEFAAQLQASLNLETGPLMRMALFNLGPDQPQRLLWIVHHLAVDGVSWRILLEDLQTAYNQLVNGQAVALPPKTTSFQAWAMQLHNYAQSPQLLQQLDYWLSQSVVASLPVDHLLGKNTEISARSVSVSLSVEQTQALLQEVPKAYHTQILDLLLTALVQTLNQWTTSNSILVDLEGHGREEIISGVDLSRTVGWFTTVFPLLLELKQPNNPELAIKSIKEQLRCIPDKGIGYGLLRYLKQDVEIQERLSVIPHPEVSFNYLGQIEMASSDGLFAPAMELTGSDRSLFSGRDHLLDIGGYITGGCLKLDWIYSENVHRRSTIEALAQSFIVTLEALISHCQSCEVGGYTPSDFPLTDMSQEELDTAFSSIEFEEA